MITEESKGIMHWLKESIVIKLICIGVLILVLLIPSVWVSNLINERAGRQQQIINEVSDQWSDSQLIKGPVLVIPYKRQIRELDANQKQITREVIENIYTLPNQLHINAALQTSKLHRGIFDVVVYNSQVNVSGNFISPNLAKLSIMPEQLMPEKARLLFSITDLKGLKTNPSVKVNDTQLSAEPVLNSKDGFGGGLQVDLNLSNVKNGTIPFSFMLDMKGSQSLDFLNLGQTTDVTVKGNWNSPSFSGRNLPDNRQVNDKGFSAKWKMLGYNRPFPQQWAADDTVLLNNKSLADATFGVKLHVPVDDYTKTTRTNKYSILIIVLTFISLFLTELIRRQKVHIFNYMLIGAAMIIYYTLLLSFSEQVGYNWAYLIASVATIGLISFFTASLLQNKAAAGMFTFILTIFYGFIYVIIQLEDLSLMVGSIALFIIIAILMYFSRKINWDR